MILLHCLSGYCLVNTGDQINDDDDHCDDDDDDEDGNDSNHCDDNDDDDNYDSNHCDVNPDYYNDHWSFQRFRLMITFSFLFHRHLCGL